MPATGADFFLIDAQFISALKQFNEAHVSLLALITWLGFRQGLITYNKEARDYGRSGWTLKKKLKWLVDSATICSYFPIRFMSYMGFLVVLCGFIYPCFTFSNALTDSPIQGWASLMVVILVSGGLQMLMIGILGKFLWRSPEESKKRPKYIIDGTTREALLLSKLK